MDTIPDSDFNTLLKMILRSQQVFANPMIPGAVVFDIDGTLITEGSWIEPIKSVVDFCNFCKEEMGLGVFIVTARAGTNENIIHTKKMLKNFGIECDSIFFRTADYDDLDESKLRAREYITKNMTYNILMSIGDNPWDMGQYGGVGVLMKYQNDKITYKVS